MIVYCPSCNHKLNVPGEIGSETIRCPVCSSEFNFDLRASSMDAESNLNPREKTRKDQRTQVAPAIKIMWKKPKKAVLIVAAIALLFLGVYSWQYSVKKKLQELLPNGKVTFLKLLHLNQQLWILQEFRYQKSPMRIFRD